MIKNILFVRLKQQMKHVSEINDKRATVKQTHRHWKLPNFVMKPRLLHMYKMFDVGQTYQYDRSISYYLGLKSICILPMVRLLGIGLMIRTRVGVGVGGS